MNAEAGRPESGPHVVLTGGDNPLRTAVIAAIRQCFDPEIPVNLYDLGLIYSIAIDEENRVKVVMTLTSPMCPVAGILPLQVKGKVADVPGVKEVEVELTWEPMWNPMMMSETARLELGMTGYQAPFDLDERL